MTAKGTRCATGLAAIALGSTISLTATAAQPPVNTGVSSFMDGFGDPRGSGFSYHQYARLSSAGSIKDHEGADIPAFDNPQLNVFVDLNQFMYTFDTHGWVAHPGVYVIVPLVLLDSSFGAGGISMEDNGFGLGDMTLGGCLQFDTVMSGDTPLFAHRLDLGVITPTGKYDPDKQINPGMNALGLNPSWAATLLPTPRLEFSTRINYLYNFANAAPGGGVSQTQAGQALFDNFAASYEILPFDTARTAALSLRLGVSGYYFKQFTENEVDGAKQSGSQEQVLGLGPGAMWIMSADNTFWLNSYFETAVRNRFASTIAQVRWVRTF